MALDLSAIKNKLNQLNNTDNKKQMLFKPEPGKTRVRIVPYVYRKENPFLELYFNYEVAKRSLLSPVTNGNPDPIAEFAEKLKNTGDKDDWLQGRKIEPKMRTFVPVIVRGKESEGVKFWGFGKTIYSELLSIISDPDYGDITDLTSGRDIDIEFTKPTMQGEYPKTSIRVKPNVTPATEDKAIAEKIMNQPKIEDIYPEPSYDELKELLQTWLNPENADADAPESVAAPTADTNSTDEPNAPSDEVKTNVADAFDKLFND
jgi:hypothetical protein